MISSIELLPLSSNFSNVTFSSSGSRSCVHVIDDVSTVDCGWPQASLQCVSVALSERYGLAVTAFAATRVDVG